MGPSRNKLVWLVAGVSALIVQSALSAVTHHFGHIGGEGPDFWGGVLLITELPGAIVGEQLFGQCVWFLGFYRVLLSGFWFLPF